MGGRRDRIATCPYPVSGKERLRGGDRLQWHRCPGQMQAAHIRPGAARRDDARHQRSGNLATPERDIPGHPRGDGHQERRREHHGPSHRLEDCRLSHQAGQSQPDIADLEEKHPQKGNRHRGDPKRLPTGFPTDSLADRQLQDHRRLDGYIQTHCALGTGTEQHRQQYDRHAADAERRGQQWFLQIHQGQLHGLGQAPRSGIITIGNQKHRLAPTYAGNQRSRASDDEYRHLQAKGVPLAGCR